MNQKPFPQSAHPHIRTSVNLYLIVAWLCLASCSSENKNQPASPLFDLKKYFESQVAELKQSNPKVQKLVIQNGQAESKAMQIEDWSAELKPFLETDISKPALKNSYRIDTLDASHIMYVAVDSAQAIRRVDLKMNNNAVTQIAILKNTGSRLLQSSQSLSWTAGSGYSISGQQTVAMGKENAYSIKVAFLK